MNIIKKHVSEGAVLRTINVSILGESCENSNALIDKHLPEVIAKFKSEGISVKKIKNLVPCLFLEDQALNISRNQIKAFEGKTVKYQLLTSDDGVNLFADRYMNTDRIFIGDTYSEPHIITFDLILAY